MVTYGCTIENENIISEKAKAKKDGVYCFRGVAYRVSSGIATHLASNGKVLERAGHFNVQIGTYEGNGDSAKLALKRII